MNNALRNSLLRIHTWSGLTVGLVAVFLAITGAAFVLRPCLDTLVNRGLLVVPTCDKPLPLDMLAGTARAAHHAGTLYSIEVDTDPNSSVAIQFTDKDYVYIDPCTGGILGTQNEYGGFFGTFDWLHRFRFLEAKTGRQLAGSAAAAFLVFLIIAGFILWWPRSRLALRSAFKFSPRLPGSARTLSLHRFVGLYSSAILAVIALTAMPIAFVPVKELIYRLAGDAQASPPKSAVHVGTPRLPMQRFWENAKAAVPDLKWISLRYPRGPADAIEAEIRERNMPHANAKSYLYMDAYTGAPLKLVPYSQIGLGRRIYLYCIALHSGLVGGLPYELTLLVAALAIPVQAYSGISPYVRRKCRTPVNGRLSLRLVNKTAEAPGICSFELRHPKGSRLPPFTAGSHINVYVRDGMVRQYSLCNDPSETDRYVIGVLRRDDSRGASRTLHDDLEVGDILETSVPRNHFPLTESARRSLLIAGGIGITPLLSMAERLASSGAEFEMHYCVRSVDRAAFVGRIKNSGFADRVTLHVGRNGRGARLGIAGLLESFDHDTHIYVCGPIEMMEAVIRTARQRGWPDAHVHREYFLAPERDPAHDTAFDVKIASSGRVIHVAKEKTVVAALAEAGIHIQTSCAQGVCGTCLLRVLDGEVEHHDRFLTAEERAKNDRFTPCCSRARNTLVLDL